MRSVFGKAAGALKNATPVPYVGRYEPSNTIFGAGGNHVVRDAKSAMEQYGQVGTLYQIVNRLATSTSMVKWHLYRKNVDGRRTYREVESRTEVTRHAALTLVNNPNPWMPWQEFTETFQQHVDLTGEAWWVASYGSIKAAGPLELWPVRPDRMLIVTDRNDFLTGYVYVSPDGEQVPLSKDIVIQLRMPNPLDIYRGLGPVQSIMTDLDSARYAAEYNRNFFINSAEPGGIIEIEDRLDDDEFRELETRWREQHRGVANAHRVAILEQGKWVDRKYTMRDMAFPELDQLNKDKIREAFGFPKAMTGATDDVNKAVAEANERIYAKYLLVPRLERIKAALNNGLLPMFGATNLEFDYEDPVPEDRAADSQERFTKAQAASTFVLAGWDPDDVLEVVGVPPMKYTEPRSIGPNRSSEGGDRSAQANPSNPGRTADGDAAGVRPGQEG